jgi:hypothetical protein
MSLGDDALDEEQAIRRLSVLQEMVDDTEDAPSVRKRKRPLRIFILRTEQSITNSSKHGDKHFGDDRRNLSVYVAQPV